MSLERRYWLAREDGEELGDYGGFMFDTQEEAEAMVRDEWQAERDLIKSGYYEPDHLLPAFTIEVSVVEQRIIMNPAIIEEET